MSSPAERYDFASDNTAGICPPAWAALEEANSGAEISYGDDEWTRRVVEEVREVFETDCEVFLIFNGTAANALALAHLCRSYHGVICHERAHCQTDECGAPEFFSGGAKLILAGGENGKLNPDHVAAAFARHPDVHSSKARALSLTQSTEFGTVYQRDEIGALADFGREHSLFVHMDGARFANAIAALDCPPRSITRDLGVDVLCFGGTKNGTPAGELVVFFNKELAREFDYRVKQGGQLASKMRFLAAPWVGLLQGGAWLENARHSNSSAKMLARKLAVVLGAEPVFPCEASAAFFRMTESLAASLRERGWRFYKFVEPDVYRLMCSWSTTERQIDDFVADVRNSLAGKGNGE
ncbi:MAG: threonine aldolase family protein [Chthoniobacterales bacterium]